VAADLRGKSGGGGGRPAEEKIWGGRCGEAALEHQPRVAEAGGLANGGYGDD
jgi:hypothetical protein